MRMSAAHPLPHKNKRTAAGLIKISVKLAPETHKAASEEARAHKQYLMDWVRSLIEQALRKTKRAA